MNPLSPNVATSAPWLTIVGIGAEGASGLSSQARAAIEQAEFVIGGARHLALVQSLLHGRAQAWPSPFAEGVAQVLARRFEPTCVLASGDPFFFGIGSTLAPRLGRGELRCFPVPSSISLAASRLGWALQDTDVVSLHGRDLSTIVRHLQPGRRVLALSWHRGTPRELSQLLVERGFGESDLTVLEVLGTDRERVRSVRAHGFDLSEIDDLNLVALDLRADPSAFVIPQRASLQDSAFEHDGQLTKREIRALTLSALAPRVGENLWDVGAGAGSIAIEWMLSHPTCGATAIEADLKRAARIRRNALALGVPDLVVVEGDAPAALHGLPTPDAVFIGGGGGDARVFELCFASLRAGGRLVMNAVALETQASILSFYGRHGGELRRFSVETAAKLGSMTVFRPALPVMQWKVTKP